MTTTEENELWKKKEAGKGKCASPCPNSCLLTHYFGVRGQQKLHSMTVEDFSFGLDENNTEYVDKNTPFWTARKAPVEASFQKMFTAEDDTDVPVVIFTEFMWRPPLEVRTTGQLCLSCVPNPSSRKFGTSGSRWERNEINDITDEDRHQRPFQTTAS